MLIEQWIGIGIWVIAFISLALFLKKESNDILSGIKGKDNIWSAEELVSILWFLFTPIIIFCSLVLGLEMSSQAWASYDLIGLIAFGTKAYLNRNHKDDS